MLDLVPLAQASPDVPWLRVLIYGGIIIGLTVLGGAGIMMFRRRVVEPEIEETGVGFSLSDLRDLRDRGELTAAEFEAASRQMRDAVRAMAGVEKDELTLKDIKEMLAKNEITPEEFLDLRKGIVDKLKGRNPDEK